MTGNWARRPGLFTKEGKIMKRNRLAAQILLVIFLASLPGIVAAAGPAGSDLSPVKGVNLSPDSQSKFTMAGGGNEMTIDSGKVSYSLQKGVSYTFRHGKKSWKVTAKENTTGYVLVKGEDLDFVYNADQLIVVPMVAEGMGGASAAAGAAGVAAVGGGGVAAGLTGGHGGSTPSVSQQ